MFEAANGEVIDGGAILFVVVDDIIANYLVNLVLNCLVIKTKNRKSFFAKRCRCPKTRRLVLKLLFSLCNDLKLLFFSLTENLFENES